MKAYLELSKPRITFMVAATAALGFRLAGGTDWTGMLWTMAGVTLTSAAAGALNQWLEKDQDALMARTSRRPLPTGRLTGAQALAFGLSSCAAGTALLAWRVNGLSAGLALATVALYVLGYTPLKRVSPQSTWIGAAAGAMPPVIGWAAAAGQTSWGAWALFAIQFLWQIPHFLTLFWLYREDYARAGFRVMPVVDPGGRATALQIAIHCFALLLASLTPLFYGAAGINYGFAALTLGTAFLALGLRASWTLSTLDSRRLFRASLLYLPLIFAMLVAGALPAPAKPADSHHCCPVPKTSRP